jgi:hypothetical protein
MTSTRRQAELAATREEDGEFDEKLGKRIT